MPQLIKLISLNLWEGGILFPKIVDYLIHEQADLLLLQEVYDGTDSSLDIRFRAKSALGQHLGYKYMHFAPTFIESVGEAEILQGNLILSQFPLTEMTVRFYDVPFGRRIDGPDNYHQSPRNLQHVITLVGKTNLHLLNTQGIWGTDGEDSDRRIEMSQIILDEIGNHHPLVLAGDFNVRPHTKSMSKIREKLTDLFYKEVKTTFNIKHKDLVKFPGFAEAVVDMMFVSHDLKILEKSVPQVDISDHLPLVCKIQI